MSYSGLYVHIPFCKSKCRYCDFNSYAKMEEYMAPYFYALLKEAKVYRDLGIKLDTVYFGGGTPTYVDLKLLSACVDGIFEVFDILPDAEVTMECNPGTVDLDGLKILRGLGINRLSIGLQSTDNKVLEALGRIHTFEDFQRCFSNARDAGFDNLSIDLMYGLPDVSVSAWQNTLSRAAAFDPEHISCYALKVEDGTPFAKMDLNLPDEDICADMYEIAVEELSKRGCKRYEISNFAKVGFESRHNLKYWRCQDFLGLGAGAYSCLGNRRFSNECSLDGYIQKINDLGKAEVWSSVQTKAEQMSEFMFLGLRCDSGVSDNEFKKRFEISFFDVFAQPVKKYTEWGFLVRDGDRLRFSDKGFFVSNTILADFV